MIEVATSPMPGHQIDDRIQAKPPTQHGHAKLVVHELAEDFQLTLDLNRCRTQNADAKTGSNCACVVIVLRTCT